MVKARRALATALVVSGALHVAAMGLHWPFGSASGASGRSSVVFTTRTVIAPAAPPERMEALSSVQGPPRLEPGLAVPVATPAPATPPPNVAAASAPRAVRVTEATVEPSAAASSAVLPPASPNPSEPSLDPSQYASSIGLSPPPRPLAPVDPVIPPAAGARGGSVVLRVFVNERGAVDKVEVVSSDPPGLFDASAIAAFGSVPYSPGLLGGVPVKAYVTFEVSYPSSSPGVNTGTRTY